MYYLSVLFPTLTIEISGPMGLHGLGGEEGRRNGPPSHKYIFKSIKCFFKVYFLFGFFFFFDGKVVFPRKTSDTITQLSITNDNNDSTFSFHGTV